MANVGIKPLGARVLVKKEDALEKTQGGLILSGGAKEEQHQGIIVAAGPGTKDEEMAVKVGDRVLFSQYGGTNVKYNGEEFMILNQKDILAIME